MSEPLGVLMEAITTPPILSVSHFAKEFMVENQTSSVAVGSVLSQKKEDLK